MTDTVHDDPVRRRFELEVDGALAFVDYRRDGRKLLLTHAEVPSALRGAGVGSALVKGTLALVRARGEKVVPLCSFVAHYMQRHPEVQDLLAEPGLTKARYILHSSGEGVGCKSGGSGIG